MSLLAARRFYILPTDTDVLSTTNKLFCNWAARDRFNQLNGFSNFKYDTSHSDPLPISLDESVSLADLVDKKALELINGAKDQDIVVSWSGGVDSTAIICALLKNGLPSKQLHILCTPSSIKEYKWFYDWMLKQGIRIDIYNELIKELAIVPCAYVVSGWCADQLFGSNIHLKNLALYNLPWIDGLNQAFKDSNIFLSKKGLDLLEYHWGKYASHLGLELKNFCEMAWLYNFGCKFSYVQQEAKLALAGTPNQDKVVPFYEGYDFQCWAIRNYTTLTTHNVNLQVKYYKRELKEYIYFFTKDPEYFNHKGKQNSWAMVGEDLASVNILTTDGIYKYQYQSKHPLNYYYTLAIQVSNKFRKVPYNSNGIKSYSN